MKLDSQWFDRIRIRPDTAPAEHGLPTCEAPGCQRRAPHRAPKGRGREGEYYRFCLDHVRDYNRRYNWFDGMSDAEMAAWQASRVTGHRPTCAMGGNRQAQQAREDDAQHHFFVDPFGLFGDDTATATAERRRLGNAEHRALDALGLDESATGPEIKARYKELVKRHHPDANGGDRSKEGRLRQIIEAYAMLRASGFYRDC